MSNLGIGEVRLEIMIVDPIIYDDLVCILAVSLRSFVTRFLVHEKIDNLLFWFELDSTLWA